MDEYEKKLQWYRKYIEDNKDSKARRVREYCNYLKRWFSDERCDGAPNYATRYLWRCTPMSYNTYFIE